MNEKRYKMMTTIIDPFPIWDTVEEKGYNCTDTLELLVDLLNELTEENEQLKKENRMLKKDLNKLYNLLMDKGMSHNELQDVLW